ncbi:MAG TPA: trypsin-like peptidase domain-containing protein, partial [Burkholderiales bacterium]|nr:trypsin-like peptidase domain-containing protein [Burkholderiales bacterium]
MTRAKVAVALIVLLIVGAFAAIQFDGLRLLLPQVRSGVLPNFASIVQRYGPAVVHISAVGKRRTGAPSADEGDGGDAPEQLFRELPQLRPPGADAPMQGVGSGLIVGADGTILTNAHLVRDAAEVRVKLNDRREFAARVLGVDLATDIAVLRIEANGLPVVRLGDPKRAQVGDWVVAIGAPFGFENSVTAGIISAKGRSLPGEIFVPFLQTDVALNPGNSGGPLFNLKGEVIGINSQIYSRSGGYQGVSFAIPIDLAQHVKGQILATGHATHARLGISIQPVSQVLADSSGLKRTDGALISSVQPGSAADRAGLRSGDVVLQYNHQPIAAANDLPSMLGMASPGDKAEFRIWRNGESHQLVAILDEAEVETESAKTANVARRSALAVRPLTPE